MRGCASVIFPRNRAIYQTNTFSTGASQYQKETRCPTQHARVGKGRNSLTLNHNNPIRFTKGVIRGVHLDQLVSWKRRVT